MNPKALASSKMHPGASVAQPCFASGAGRETRTPTPKRWYLKPMRLPIPPYPHVGRRYVTMFRKGQARLVAAFRFIRTFIGPSSGSVRTPAALLPAPKGNGPATDRKTAALLLPPHRLAAAERTATPHAWKHITFMRLHDIIYRAFRMGFREGHAPAADQGP
jgi:hypothetical protein